MLIEEERLTYWINNFYGYGAWNARIWFIGYEEGGGDLPEEVAEKFNYLYDQQSTFASLCDVREVYRQVAFRQSGSKANIVSNHYEYRFDRNATLHGVWKNLIAFAHGYRNETLPDALAYQKEQFLLPHVAHEALIKLYPLPCPHNHGWYYSWLDLPQLTFLKSRTLYEEHVYEMRIHRILENMSAYRPDVVLMYGMNNITRLKHSVQNFYPNVTFKMVKAIKQQMPQYHWADLGNTMLLITTQLPALHHGRIESGFDWMQLGRTIANL
jgi:hypothetical protein